jgi:hypothetical protein
MAQVVNHLPHKHEALSSNPKREREREIKIIKNNPKEFKN